MKTFGHVFTLTNGGPGKSSMVLALYAYNTSLVRMNLGYGSTVAVGILIISLFLIFMSQLLLKQRKDVQ
jgi:raffinose/stachyose/melibiose transport system permease protein